ncbi:MAG: OmpA family protein [bacterium]|nr:OmpA family protein [bacterium]
MSRHKLFSLCLFILAVTFSQALAVDQTAFRKLEADMDAARLAEANIFSPETWEKAMDAYEKAQKDIQKQKKQKTLDEHVAEAAEYTANAVKAAEVCKLSLQEYLDPRERAKAAGGPGLVPALYQEAEKQFMKATEDVEDGDVKDGLEEAAEAGPMFDKVEMEAIRFSILHKADLLIAKAVADEADDFAVTTLDKARSARSRANTVLTADRYNRTESVADAKLAEYEALHASNIAKSVRSLDRNDQAWEKLMLGYEIQMNRAGVAFGNEYLPFDSGAEAAATILVDNALAVQQENENLRLQLKSVTASLRGSLNRVESPSTSVDPRELADLVDREILTMLASKRDLNDQISEGKASLAEVSLQQQKAQYELSVRREKDDKFKAARRLFNPSEGKVLYNASNDIVLRLHGLSFKVGRSEIQDSHVTLLAKVQDIIEMYPASSLVIEGHTDLTGDPLTNVTLSEKRAYSIMQYLRETMMINANKIRAVGFGADKPVASNKTEDGRAKNRRIDIIVMQNSFEIQ